MHIPTDTDVKLNPSEDAIPPNAYVPERCIHTWVRLTYMHMRALMSAWSQQGCLCCATFPSKWSLAPFSQYGHQDQGKSQWSSLTTPGPPADKQLWDIYHEGNCLRTFMGHSQAVKDVAFNRSGERFLSASFDRQIKMWDTETGKCTFAFSNGKIPNVVKFHPDADKQNIFMAGMQDKKIIQVSCITVLRETIAHASTTRDSERLCKHMTNILDRSTQSPLSTAIVDS